MATHIIANFDPGKNGDSLRNNLNWLEGKRDDATLRTAAYKQRMAKYYNSRVKARRFAVRDLVLKKTSLVT